MINNSEFKIRIIQSPDGTTRHLKGKQLHNDEGPAVIYANGKEEYYLNGILFTKDAHKKAKRDLIGLPWYKSGVAKSRN